MPLLSILLLSPLWVYWTKHSAALAVKSLPPSAGYSFLPSLQVERTEFWRMKDRNCKEVEKWKLQRKWKKYEQKEDYIKVHKAGKEDSFPPSHTWSTWDINGARSVTCATVGQQRTTSLQPGSVHTFTCVCKEGVHISVSSWRRGSVCLTAEQWPHAWCLQQCLERELPGLAATELFYIHKTIS